MVGTTDHNLLVGVSAPRGNLYASIMDPRSTSSAGRTRALPASIILAKGAECREQTHSSVCGEEFSLDIPFYRTRPKSRLKHCKTNQRIASNRTDGASLGVSP